MTSVTRWWLIRHAPVLGMKGRLYGSRDVPCDTSNTAMFVALAKKLPAEALWITSQLNRAIETAAAIRAAGLDAPLPEIEPDLCEQNFGDWAGKDISIVWKELKHKREKHNLAK